MRNIIKFLGVNIVMVQQDMQWFLMHSDLAISLLVYVFWYYAHNTAKTGKIIPINLLKQYSRIRLVLLSEHRLEVCWNKSWCIWFFYVFWDILFTKLMRTLHNTMYRGCNILFYYDLFFILVRIHTKEKFCWNKP